MAKIEGDVVTPAFFRRFFKYVFNRKRKYEPDDLFHKMNHYDHNIELTVWKKKVSDTSM